MSIWNNDRKVRAVASDLAEAMRRRYGPAAEAICSEALARRELSGARRRITGIALQILRGLTTAPEQRPLGKTGRPIGAAR